jgi:endonuclease/exonuclease/phosphatase family metal-dependent hydrolase
MAAKLRVMTFNIRHGEGVDGRVDLPRIANVVRAHAPDLVALQEVDRHFDERSGFVDQAWTLGRELGMTALFAPGMVLDPPAPGRPLREYGNAVLSAREVVAWDAIPYPTWPGKEGRGLLRAEITVDSAVDRGVAAVWNTHLAYDNAEQRADQVRAIRKLIADDGHPTALLGDLNAEPDSDVLTELTRDLTDAWTVAGSGPGHSFDSVRPKVRIDYVLTGPGVRTTRIETAPVDGGTDHLAVVADLLLG